MKKILFLVVVLLSIVSAKLYSSNQELVFEETSVMQDNTNPPGTGVCMYKDGAADCSLGNLNGCAAVLVDGECNSDPPSPPSVSE